MKSNFALLNPALRWKDVIIYHAAKSHCRERREVTEEFADPDNRFNSRYYSCFAAHKQHLVRLPLAVTCYISLVSFSVIETDRHPLDFNKRGIIMRLRSRVNCKAAG